MNKKYLIFIPVLMIILSLQNNALATVLQLTVGTDKPSYRLGYPVTVGGNLTMNGNPVSDGLVAIEVLDPRGNIMVIRTVTTGTEPPEPWMIEITGLSPCDATGKPMTSVKQGGSIGVKATLNNTDNSQHVVKVLLYIQYSNNVPCQEFIFFDGPIAGNHAIGPLISYPILIDDAAPTGNTFVYMSALVALPSEGGFAYCPEQETTFIINPSSSSVSSASVLFSTMSSQAYSLIFAVSSHGGILGNYTIYAASKYSYYVASCNAEFADVLTTDINGPGGKPDRKVDIMDVAMACGAFGSYPGHPRWDSRADVNKDGKVDITDVSMVVGDFGKWGVLP